MDSKWMETFLLYSKTDEHIAKVELSKKIIRENLERSQKPYVAFSGGKDSSCVLHLVSLECPDITVVHWDYGMYYIPRPWHEKIINNARMMSKNIRIYTSELYNILKRNAQFVMEREFLGKKVKELKNEGFDLAFVGLRKEESIKRRMRISKKRNITVIREVSPIADWSWLDVWAYIVSNNVPYLNEFYDVCGDIIGYDKARFTTIFDPQFAHLGNIDGVLFWRFKNIK